MSEPENNGGGAGTLSVVLVEPSAASRHNQPLRSTDITEETAELHHKCSKAPAVPFAEELKDKVHTNVDVNERRESERAMESEKHKHVSNKLSNTKRRASFPDAITSIPIELETKVSSVTPPTQPIPAQISEASISEAIPEIIAVNTKKEEDYDSITEDITEMRTSDITTEWREEEEAGGLPRSESRGSRVVRAVRQLLCCGVHLEAPSEHRISPRPFEGI